MKVWKSLLLALVLLFFSGISTMAATPSNVTVQVPTQYFDENYKAQPVEFNGQIMESSTSPEVSEGKAQGAATNLPQTTTLTPSPDGSSSWYWAGQTLSDTIPASVNITSLSFRSQDGSTKEAVSGIVNIVVGPNGFGGSTPAVSVQSAITIPAGVTVYIYEAADGLFTETGNNLTPVTPTNGNCFIQFKGQAVEATDAATGSEVKTKSPQAGITVENGATLEVKSGSITGQGCDVGSNSDPTEAGIGVQIDGNVTVDAHATLQANSGQGAQESIPAISINTETPSGSLTSNGGTILALNAGSNGAFINGVSNYKMQGGYVATSTEFPGVSTSVSSGVWEQVSATGLSKVTVFGTSTYPSNGYGSAYGNQSTYTFLPGAQLTVPNGQTFQFNSGSTLTLNEGSVLTIAPEATINMGEGSTLDNQGTINVQAPEPAA